MKKVARNTMKTKICKCCGQVIKPKLPDNMVGMKIKILVSFQGCKARWERAIVEDDSGGFLTVKWQTGKYKGERDSGFGKDDWDIVLI